MPKRNSKGVDLEERFIKKFSPTIFVSMLNTSPQLVNLISKELADALFDIYEEMRTAGKASRAIVDVGSEEVVNALLAAPPDRCLHRTLHRQSRFFNEIKCASFMFASDGAPTIGLHMEESPPLSTARLISPHDLDALNKYVLLHMLPYLAAEWRKSVEDDNYQRVHKILEEVVMDKIGGLRELRQEEEVTD